MGGRGIVLVGLLGTPGTARGGDVSESIAKAPRRANGTRGPWCRSSRTTPDAETCTSPSSVQFQPSFSSAKYTSRRRGGPTTAAVNRGDDRPGASPVIRREGLTVYYASSPSATPPFLVQWRVKERSRRKRAWQTRSDRWTGHGAQGAGSDVTTHRRPCILSVFSLFHQQPIFPHARPLPLPTSDTFADISSIPFSNGHRRERDR